MGQEQAAVTEAGSGLQGLQGDVPDCSSGWW